MGDRGRRLRREGGLGRRGRLRGEGGREQRWVVGAKGLHRAGVREAEY